MGSSAEEAEVLRAPSKPFGVGIGPVYISGHDTDLERTELTLKIYKQYINYKRLSQQSLRENEEYYARWTDQNLCIGGCPRFSTCRQGVCVCDHTQCKFTIIYHVKIIKIATKLLLKY